MTETYWPRPAAPHRVAGDPDRVVFLIPGLAYSAERPLLHFARAVFLRHGWTTQEVWWPQRPPQRAGQDLPVWFGRQRSFVHAHLSRILSTEAAPKIALVGKSMGAFAAALAADRGLPGIWLTPVLRDSDVPGDLRRSTAPFLLVGGSADPSWDAGLARGLGRPFFEAENADHGMETDADPVNSADILRRATSAMDTFVARL
ncbi:alpha/beta hydrolase [Actinoplanes sp. NPDC049599]|uniref:alpha/beta hydrolase n=1 Tax=Actinoplanes sp. NPDC049599 TaxID=3363903 RepID=UPI003799A335